MSQTDERMDRGEGRGSDSDAGAVDGPMASSGIAGAVSPIAARWAAPLAAGLIVLATLAAYANSFQGVFVFDDQPSIVDNPTIRHLWPIWRALFPPSHGETVSGRPLLNLTFAVNYALGGLNPWGYHAVNLAIHILAALALFGILCRTLRLPPLRDRFGRSATLPALAISLLWAVHPLQTESVTYVAQRAESLCGLFYLLTLYCFIRGATIDPASHPPSAVRRCGILPRSSLACWVWPPKK